MFDRDSKPCERVDDSDVRKFAAVAAVGQGLLTAVAPGVSIRVIKRLLGVNFENADALVATPAYRRQLRAIGIGTAAAGIAGYAMERVATAAESDAADSSTADTKSED